MYIVHVEIHTSSIIIEKKITTPNSSQAVSFFNSKEFDNELLSYTNIPVC